MRLTRFITFGAGAVIALAVCCSVANFLIGNATDAAVSTVMSDNASTQEASRKLTLAAADVRFDVVQVQQYLTDIAATRGLDGLDDGPAEAERFAKKLQVDLVAGRALAEALGREAVVGRFDEVAAAFDPYYQAGKNMAATYVADGPEAGNKLMPEFDAVAESIASAVDAMLIEIDAYVAEVNQRAVAGQAEAHANESLRALVNITSNVIMIVAILVMALFTRRQFVLIDRVTLTASEIARGNYDVPRLGTSFWHEIGRLFEAIGVFRDNGEAMKAMSRSQEADLKRNAEEQALRNALQDDVARVVAAAAEGDFSARVAARYDRPDLDRLARDLNALMSGFESGLTEIGATLEAIASDDLTQRVGGDFRGAFARLKDNTNAVADRLSEIVGRLRQTSGILKTATAEILNGAVDLGERTGKQAGIVAETSSAMAHIAGTGSGNARKAGEVHEKTAAMSAAARESGKVVEAATEAMQRISTSSARISNIIGLIDDIAFQTNLLALNASVEAARAGEAGKGFAVVAIEVRRLAQSAAGASSEVKALIEQSAVEVRTGTGLVASVAEKLLGMLSVMGENDTETAAISRDSQDQARSIAQVDASVKELEKMTQHNAALAEQTNRAIEQMEAHVGEMEALVGLFTLAGSGARTGRHSGDRAA